MAETALTYERASRLSTDTSAAALLDLGRGIVPVGGTMPFFDGWVARPRLVAQLLLAVAAVARSRYFQPISARLLDPILTSGDGRLRVESFSSCCGVYARADLLPDGLRDVESTAGTTNVDLNRDVRDALARLDDTDELRLSVGQAGLHVTTRDTSTYERKVALPTRWVKGLGEAGLAQVGMQPYAHIDAAATRRLLAGLPPAGPASEPGYVLQSRGRELRFQASGTGAFVAGPYRLREMALLAPYAQGLTVWSRPDDAARASAFQLDLPGARLWLVLSPHVARGFSGEGQSLTAVADPAAVAEAVGLRPAVEWSARIDEVALARSAGLAVERIATLLAVLGSQGLVGRDAVESAWFRRDLPFAVERIGTLAPRVRSAGKVAASDVSVTRTADGYEVFVRSGQIEHRVVLIGESFRCTCLWYSKHRESRGPCRHVLAARREVDAAR